MEKKDYEMADLLCISIIQKEEARLIDPKAWLNKYKGLYSKFNIQPGNLPAIANCNFEGIRYDCGDKLGFMKANIEFSKKHPEIGSDFVQYLKSLS